MAHLRRFAVALGLTFVLFGTSFVAVPATAAVVPVTLYGSTALGWGPTNISLATPGPTIVAAQGDNITLTLYSADGTDHNWYIDYDGDASDDGNEPDSPDFNTNVTWTFTADRNGTFAYRSRFGADEARMWGLITIRPPGTGGGPSPTPGADNTPLLVAAGVGVLVAVFAIAALVTRRRKLPPPPPPQG